MAVRPSPRVTRSEEVYRALRRDILTLERTPGSHLTEQELADAYGSSRVPVREACRRLQQEGLVTSIPYKGYLVSQISLQEIVDSFELRLVLERHAAEQAVARATPADLDRLEALARTEYTAHDWSSYGQFLARNQQFHLAVAALGGNRRLVGTLADLLDSMQRYFFLGLDLGDYGPEMRGEHQRLVDHLRRGDRDAVVASARTQIDSSRERILRALAAGGVQLPLT